MTISQALKWAFLMLKATSCSPHLDAEVLLISCLKTQTKAFLYAHPEFILSPKTELCYRRFINRARKNEPIAYITGYKEFYKLKFAVNRHVLIPRPETETLVEAAIANIRRASPTSIIDVGTGSGCIIIALLKNLPKNQYAFYALDISKHALAVAKKNAKRLGVLKRIRFIQSDLLRKANRLRLKPHVLITANLPYISRARYQKLASSIKNYEPKTALISGKNGLVHYYKLLTQIRSLPSLRYLSISLFLEIDPQLGQRLAQKVKALWQKTEITIKDRLLMAHFKN